MVYLLQRENKKKMTDDQIKENACVTKGCTNYSYEGYFCRKCMNNIDEQLDPIDAARKLELEKNTNFLDYLQHG